MLRVSKNDKIPNVLALGLALLVVFYVSLFYPRQQSAIECPTILEPAPEPQPATCACAPCPLPKVEFVSIAEQNSQKPTKFSFKKQDPQSIKNFLDERQRWSPKQWEAEAMRLMKKNQIGRYTIIATANLAHLNFTLNWIASLKLNQYDKFLVYSFDFQLYSILVEYGYADNVVMAPLTWTKFEIPPNEHKWMERIYKKLTESKLRIQFSLLEQNFWILFSDVDLVFCSPRVLDHVRFLVGEYCSEQAESQCFTDFAYMYDQDTDINTGFFVARPTPIIKEVFNNTIAHIDKFGVDQLAFNYEIRTIMKIKYSKTFKGLDKLLYANGLVFSKRKLNEKFGIKPMVVHANYYEGYEAKKQMLQKYGYWYLD